MNATTTLHRLCVAGGLSLVLLFGCDPKDSSLGDLPEDETTDASESGSEPVSPTETGPVETSIVGEPCTLSSTPEAVFLDRTPNDVCGDAGYCLYAPREEAPFEDCNSDDMCGGSDGEFYCDLEVGRCALTPSFIAARSMCTQTCETAADCVGVEGTLCESGFSCEPVASLGELCCQPVCVCNDDLDVASAQALRNECENGDLSELPGCP